MSVDRRKQEIATFAKVLTTANHKIKHAISGSAIEDYMQTCLRLRVGDRVFHKLDPDGYIFEVRGGIIQSGELFIGCKPPHRKVLWFPHNLLQKVLE